uniref:Uncharacterized protein n=1 Tax=Graphocephala atropunctata TaxID=36148 RepID=A0A1B6MHU5_9HEMI
MRLKRIMLRYFPPGIGLEYIQGGCTKTKEIDLFDLTSSTDIEELAFAVAKGEPLITPNIHHQLVDSLRRLQKKIFSTTIHRFYRHKTLKTHLLPLTNVAFDKFGKKCLTGSYDRTCKVWDIETGEEVHTLQGHKNVVYAVAFNNPSGDKILTGSFDKTARLWSYETGECKQTFSGHSGEVVAVQFDPQKQLIATASMDTTARLYNSATGSL